MAIAALPKTKSPPRVWTYEEMLAELPETNQPVELWDGEITMSPSPHPDHQRIVLRFSERLNRFVCERKLGEVFISPLDVVLSPRRVVQPDVLFVSNNRRHIIRDHIYGVPDLVVEVISAGTWQRDRVSKKALYEQFGLPEYWIVDPDSRTIEVFAYTKGAYELHARGEGEASARSRILPGFEVAFSELAQSGP